MDPATIASIGGTVLSTLGGLFKKNKAPQLDLGALRRNAKANGFNPLTVLRMTGGSGYMSSGSQPHPLGVIGDGLANVGSLMAYAQDREVQTKEAESRIRNLDANTAAQVQTMKNAQAARMAPVTRQGIKQKKSPYYGMHAKDIPMKQVRAMNGGLMTVRADVLERLKINEGDTLITEDFEAIVGEIGGELAGISTIVDEAMGIGVPWYETTGGSKNGTDKKTTMPSPVTRIKTEFSIENAKKSVQTLKDIFGNSSAYAPPVSIKKPQSGWMEQKFGPMH